MQHLPIRVEMASYSSSRPRGVSTSYREAVVEEKRRTMTMIWGSADSSCERMANGGSVDRRISIVADDCHDDGEDVSFSCCL